jgi:hypothetical protein
MSTSAARDIIWIASYPKSGNTWVRFMLANLIYGSQASAASLAALIPDIHEIEPGGIGIGGARLLKTHFIFSPNHPLAARTAAAIYIVRRPEDVLTSNFHYQRRIAGAEVDIVSFERYVEEFIAHRGDPRWKELGMGDWAENVRSWLGVPHEFPVLGIKYEDLAADAIGICRQLAHLLRPASTREEIEQAVERASFASMRAIEEADIRNRRVGIFYKPYLQEAIDAGRRFMRAGSVGEGAARLSELQRARLAAAFATEAERIGYRS